MNQMNAASRPTTTIPTAANVPPTAPESLKKPEEWSSEPLLSCPAGGVMVFTLRIVEVYLPCGPFLVTTLVCVEYCRESVVKCSSRLEVGPPAPPSRFDSLWELLLSSLELELLEPLLEGLELLELLLVGLELDLLLVGLELLLERDSFELELELVGLARLLELELELELELLLLDDEVFSPPPSLEEELVGEEEVLLSVELDVGESLLVEEERSLVDARLLLLHV